LEGSSVLLRTCRAGRRREAASSGLRHHVVLRAGAAAGTDSADHLVFDCDRIATARGDHVIEGGQVFEVVALAEQILKRQSRTSIAGRFSSAFPHGSKFAVAAFAAALYFRASCLGAAGPVRRHPIALRPGKGQLSHRIGRERTCCTCLWLTRLQVRRGLHGGGDHASHPIHCRPAQGRMADQVR